MNCKQYLFAIFIILSLSVHSQTSINYIFSQIEQNNAGLQYMQQATLAAKTGNKTINNLKNPSFSYSHKYHDEQISVSQSFDFPTAYYYRSQVNKLKGKQLDVLYEKYRQELLLTAKLTCLNIIFLNQQNEVLHTRHQNAIDLAALYQERVNEGKSDPLEKNKIDLERINTEANLKSVEASLMSARSQLQALNGGIPLEFDLLAYTDTTLDINLSEVQQAFLSSDYKLIAQHLTTEINRKEITVTRTNSLPDIEIGIKKNILYDHTPGYSVGLSLPLFENRNKLKVAKLNLTASKLQGENVARELESECDQLVIQYNSLKESLIQFRRLFKTQNNLDIINKYIHNENITMIDYFVELNSYYASLETLLELENQFQIVSAKLQKYKL